jgi:hypothetical protein
MRKWALPLLWLALPVCLFLFVLGMRWGIAERYGMALPDWDQWDAEGLHLLAPWYQGRLTWAELASPQNEHRVIVSKLINLGLTVANGQWDQRVEVAFNSALPALIATGLFLYGRSRLGAAWDVPLFCLLAGLYGLPLAWENIVNGFHSPQHFLVGLSFLAIALLPFHRPGSARWWLGAASLALALGTLASGFFAALIVAGLIGVRWRRAGSRSPAVAATLALCALALAVGALTRVTVSGHAALRAQSVADFVMTIVRALGWPAFDWGWGGFGLLLWVPWFWVAALALRRRVPAPAFAELLLGLGGWVLLQVLATAYARGAGGPSPASRYSDTLAAGLAVNGLCLAWLGQEGLAGRKPLLRLLALLGSVWTLLLAGTAAQQTHEIWTQELGPAKQAFYYCEQNVRHFLATGDRAFLDHAEIPYPSAEVLFDRIQIPELRRILPATVRPPLALAAAAGSAGFAQADTRRPQAAPAPGGPPIGLSPRTPPLDQAVTWGSYRGAGTAAAGPWRSEPLRTTLHGWLWFVVAGDLGESGSLLELRDPNSGRLLAKVRPDRHPGDSWRSAYVPSPAGAFVVVAAEPDPGHWFAFSQPVEVGSGSYWAWRAMKQGFLLAAVAAATAALAALAGAALARPQFKAKQ